MSFGHAAAGCGGKGKATTGPEEFRYRSPGLTPLCRPAFGVQCPVKLPGCVLQIVGQARGVRLHNDTSGFAPLGLNALASGFTQELEMPLAEDNSLRLSNQNFR